MKPDRRTLLGSSLAAIAAAGVSSDTLRHGEREGLLLPSKRPPDRGGH